MALEIDQAKWLNRYTRVTPPLPIGKTDGKGESGKPDPLEALKEQYERLHEQEIVETEKMKDLLLTKAQDAVFAYKDVLRAAFDFEMGSGKKKEKMRDDVHGDQEKEVDSRDINKRAQKGEKISTYKDGEEDITLLSQATNAYDIVVKEKQRLTTAMTKKSVLNERDVKIDTTYVPLFVNNEVTDLFFTPLVRARLIPDGAITNDFSATQRMLDATNQIYIDNELKGASDPTSKVDEIGGTIAGIAGTIASTVTEQLGVSTDMSKGLIEAGVALVSLGVSASTLALGIEDKDVVDLCGKIPDIAGKIVAAATGNKDIGDAIASGGAVATKIAKAGAAKLKGKPVTGADIGNLVKECLLEVLTQATTIAGDKGGGSVGEALKLLATAAEGIDPNKVASIAEGVKTGDWKKVSSGIIQMVSDFSATAPKVAGAAAKLDGNELNKNLEKALGQAGDAVSKSLTLVAGVVTAKNADEVADKLITGIPDLVSGIVGKAMGEGDVTNAVKQSSGALKALGTLMKDAVKGELKPESIIGVFEQFTSNLFKAIGDEKGAEQAKSVIDGLTEAFKKSKAVTELASAKDPEAMKKAAGKLLLDLLAASPGIAGEGAKGGGGESDKAAEGLKKAQELIDTFKGAGEGAQEELEKATKEVEAIRKQLEEEHDKDAEEEADALLDQFEKEREEYRKQLKAAFQSDADPQLIMKAIADMKRDQAIMNIAISLGSAGIEVASQFFAPLAVGKELLKMVVHLTAAIERAQDLKRMLDAKDWSQSAVSIYQSTIKNFVKNQGEQLAEHSIKAAMCALRAASEIAATAFPLAKAASTGVSIAQSAVDVGFAIYKEADLRKAWKTTKEALEDTDDRKLGLKARRLNATLAKYAIAYGAVTEKDPVAVKTMNEVGLTNDMLQSEEAGVSLVQKFLETRFSEDAKVAFKWDATAEWQKKLPAPELAVPNIFAVFDQMGRAAEPVFGGPQPALAKPPNALVGALSTFKSASKKWTDAKAATAKLREAGKKQDADIDARKAYRDALKAETEAGADAARLAASVKVQAGKLVGTVAGLSSPGADAKAVKAFTAAAANVVAAYRSLAEDEQDAIESDLLTPNIELAKAEASIKTMEKVQKELSDIASKSMAEGV